MGDGALLAQTITELAAAPQSCRAMGERARRAFEDEFDKPIAIARWVTLLREVGVRPRDVSRPAILDAPATESETN